MNREEAIANLKMIRVAFVLPVTKEQRKLIDDTFEMAIQALSQEPICDRDCEHCTWTECPIDDVVSRILKRMWNCRGKHTTSIDKVKMEQIIRDELPSVTQKSGKWIPVSERVPQDHDWYLIVVKEKSTGYQYIPRVATYLHDNDWVIIDTEDANEEWLNDLVCVAWMPLPEPFKPQERSDKE